MDNEHMDKILGKSIESISFEFLKEQEDVEHWDNTLYHLFQWAEIIEQKDKDIHIFLLNDKNLFYKIPDEKKISVYYNHLKLLPLEKRQLILICSTFDSKIKCSLKKSLQKILEREGKNYRILETDGIDIESINLGFLVETSI